jgi:4-hydroxy 2-oxovalerate aldolase
MTRVLDCTFRDGGYYNNWDFHNETAATYLDGIARLPIEMVEIGYCNHPSKGYYGKYYYLTRDDLIPVREALREDQKLAVMLDAKNADPARVHEIVGNLTGIVHTVRLAVAPDALLHGLALARALRKLGFEVGFNVMYLSKWADDVSQVSLLAGAADAVNSVALVDSFGSCTPDQVGRATKAMREMIDFAPIGFHGHDNIGLSFANTLAAVEAGAEIVDGTFVGMGRGAGNLRTELMLVHLAAKNGTDLDYDALSAIVGDFEDMQKTYGWGTNLAYMISGAAKLPQRDVMDWLGKNRYSVSSILRALQSQRSGEVDETAIEPLRSNSVTAAVSGEVVIVGGGPSVARHLNALQSFVKRSGAVVIHASTRHLDLVGKLGEQQVMCLAGQGALRLEEGFPLESIQAFVVSAPPRFKGSVPDNPGRPIFQVNPYEVRGEASLGPVSDIGPIALALAAARDLGAKRILLVGVDGYPDADAAKQELAREVQHSLDTFQKDHADIQIEALTPTLYDVRQGSIYSRLSEITA